MNIIKTEEDLAPSKLDVLLKTHISRAAAAEAGDGVDHVLLHLGTVSYTGHQLLQEPSVLHICVRACGVHRGALTHLYWDARHAAHDFWIRSILLQLL